MGLAFPLEELKKYVTMEDVYAPMPFTDFHDMKETDTGGLLVLATVQIPALNLDVKTMVHGVAVLFYTTPPTFYDFFLFSNISPPPPLFVLMI